MRRTAVSLVAAASIALAGCGGDDGGTSAGDYASDVCSAARDWVGAIQRESSEVRGELGPNASPAQGKQVLQRFLDDTIRETNEFAQAVDDAGEPDVDGGGEAANALKDAVNQAKGILENARSQADQLPTDDTDAFRRQADALGDSTRQSLSSVGDAFRVEQSSELREAFEDSNECQGVSGGGGS